MNKNKTNADLLTAYKKSNKERRERIVALSGLRTEAKYLEFLNSKGPKKSPVVPKGKPTPAILGSKTPKAKTIPTIHNVHILDASGSMATKIDGAVNGINEDVKGLKAQTLAKYTHTFITFSGHDDYKVEEWLTPIDKVKVCPRLPTRDMTALHDAIGKTLTDLMKAVPKTEKVLVKIFTDGAENNSRVWRSKQIKDLIKECEGRGFTITFVGTENDVKEVISSLAIDYSNTLSHDNTLQGVNKAFKMSNDATAVYTVSVSKGEDVKRGFFKKKGKL